MKKGIFAVVFASLLLSISPSIQKTVVRAAGNEGTVDITISKVEIISPNDNFNRLAMKLYNKEGIIIENNAGIRNSGAAFTRPKVSINGTDWSFDTSDYFACFGQIPAGTEAVAWPVYLKRSAGSADINFYPSNYPGFVNGTDATITFHKGSHFGKYNLLNDFTLHLTTNNVFTFINDPQEIKAVNCSVSGSYTFNSKTCVNAGSEIIVTPNKKPGQIATSLSFKEIGGSTLNIDYEQLQDKTYKFVMPQKGVEVEPIYEDITYTIDFGGGVTKEVIPNQPIGDIPEGNWQIDGCNISDESNYIWEENKTAVKVEQPQEETYTIRFIVDDQVLTTKTFTKNDATVEFPAIPYKAGYKIIGWDTNKLCYKNYDVHAIYEQIESN